MTNDTRTCDACGRRYEFTSSRDRCPYCCPEQKRDDDTLDDEPIDEVYDDDD